MKKWSIHRFNTKFRCGDMMISFIFYHDQDHYISIQRKNKNTFPTDLPKTTILAAGSEILVPN